MTTTRLLPYQQLTYDQQMELLAQLVNPDLVKTNQNVKGPYTSGDYVEDMLRRVFGPDQVSIEILGNQNVQISESELYAQALIRLKVTFANGQTITMDGIGVWPLKASQGKDLSNTPSERYETAIKSSVTDAIKNAAEKIGRCFRPITDDTLTAYLGRLAYEAGKKLEDKTTPKEKRAAMFGENGQATTTTTPTTPTTPEPTPEPTQPGPLNAEQMMKQLRSRWSELYRESMRAKIKLDPIGGGTTIEQLRAKILDAEKQLDQLKELA